MKIKKFNIYELIYLSFAFDSLLKFNLGGFRVHIGILAILILSAISFLQNPRYVYFKGFFKANWSLLPFIIYLVFSISINASFFVSLLVNLLYFILGIWVFYFLFRKESYISDRSIISFQWILISTGLFQYLLYHLFGYQLAFFDPDHYEYDLDFATRLRGFYLEPNWHSIIVTFNSLLIVMRYGKNALKHKALIVGTFAVIVFNGSYGFIAAILLAYMSRTVIFLPKISKANVIATIVMILITGSLLVSRQLTKSEGVGVNINHGARLFPALRTVLFMSEQSVADQILGMGLGSWPYIGLEQNSLGYLGVTTGGEYTIKPGQRDSAEFQVFLLELGYLGIFLFLFDYGYNYWKFRRINAIYSISAACLIAAFFLYGYYRFAMYLVPFYMIRSIAVKYVPESN